MNLVLKLTATSFNSRVAVYEKPKFPMGATSVCIVKKALFAVSLGDGDSSWNSGFELFTSAGFAVTDTLVYGYKSASSTWPWTS